MRFEGTAEFAAPRQMVWDFLTDPLELAGCVEGAPSVERVDATHYRAPITVGSGFFKTSATIDLRILTTRAPDEATMEAQARAAAGSVLASIALRLRDAEPGGTVETIAEWSAEVTLGGMLGGLGGMLDAPVRSQADRTLACAKAKVEARAAGA